MRTVSGYDEQFYSSSAADLGRTSAAAVAGMVHEIVRPSSMVDFGCGNGAWVKAFAELGVDDHTGIDGPWVDREWLEFDAGRFQERDLAAGVSLDRTFDLAMSVEVAEHLPGASADRFVATLTEAAPVVLFSAAIPFQGGTGHVNEQWPAYWAAKFEDRGYVAVDALRPKIWERDDIAYYYRQNITFFVRRDVLGQYPPSSGSMSTQAGRCRRSCIPKCGPAAACSRSTCRGSSAANARNVSATPSTTGAVAALRRFWLSAPRVPAPANRYRWLVGVAARGYESAGLAESKSLCRPSASVLTR